MIGFGFAGVHGSGWGIDFRTLVGCLVCFDLWGCIFRLAFFGVRLLWVGFPFLDAWVDGGSMPGHVWGTLACFPVYGHGWHGLGFVAGLGHDFALLFGFWLFICGPGW